MENDEQKPVLLCSLVDDAQARIVVAALKEQGIPVLEKFAPGPSIPIIIGFTYQNIDIYVPSGLMDMAKETLSVVMGADTNEPYDENLRLTPIFSDSNDIKDKTKNAGHASHNADESPVAHSLRIALYIVLLLIIGVPFAICLAYILIKAP